MTWTVTMCVCCCHISSHLWRKVSEEQVKVVWECKKNDMCSINTLILFRWFRVNIFSFLEWFGGEIEMLVNSLHSTYRHLFYDCVDDDIVPFSCALHYCRRLLTFYFHTVLFFCLLDACQDRVMSFNGKWMILKIRKAYIRHVRNSFLQCCCKNWNEMNWMAKIATLNLFTG